MALDPDWYFDHVLFEAGPAGAPHQLGPEARWRAWWRHRARALPGSLAPLAGAQGFCMRTAQLTAAGVPRHVVRRLVAREEWWSPQRGVVCLVDPRCDDVTPDRWTIARRRHALSCAAAALVNPGHLVAGRSAAVLHGLPTTAVPDDPRLLVPAGSATRRRGAAVPTHDVDDWWGVSVTAPARTVVDVARGDRVAGLVAADAALRARLADRAGLEHAVTAAARRPHVARAREIVLLADPGAESAPESLARLRVHDAGLPAPQLQVEIEVPGRHRPYRVDMLWQDFGLVVELDGRVKYEGDVLWREKRREDEIRALGYRLVRLSWHDLTAGWAVTRERLARLLT